MSSNPPANLRGALNFYHRTRTYGPSRVRPNAWERDKAMLSPGTPAVADAKVPRASEEELANVLTVKNIDLHIEDNTYNHYTDWYENTEVGGKTPAELVVRRADEFEMTIEFSRPYDKDKDDVRVTFKIGQNPLPTKGTLANLKIVDGTDTSYKPNKWGVRIVKQEENFLTVAVFVPAVCVIGEWILTVKTVVIPTDGKKIFYQYENPTDVIILLNPWSEDDVVYLSSETQRDEYVMNEAGALWIGTANNFDYRTWYFGQFCQGILDASFHLLRKAFGYKIDNKMADPVVIARGLSRIINSNDDEGCLVGKWTGDYRDGTRPTAWAGSVKILQSYMSKGEAVKYGQCWVFSGIATTVCRALGLPTRSVTNFNSAHDTDASCSIDSFYYHDENLDLKRAEDTFDSVWNFHVWNEVWMKRNDLPSGYDGWQVIDATPQESSDDLYQLGPSPKAAIKKGEVNINHDTAFVFAEVNGDSVDWLVEDDEFHVMSVDENAIGQYISTRKAMGWDDLGDEREDITHEYKFKEGSEENRTAVKLATKLSIKPHGGVTPDLDNTKVHIAIDDIGIIHVGEDFGTKVKVENTGTEDRKVRVCVKVEVITYRGERVAGIVLKHFDEMTINGGKEETLSTSVNASDYIQHTVDHFAMKVTAVCFIIGQGKVHVVEEKFRLKKPLLLIEGPKTCGRDEVFNITVSFTNPLNKPLTDCHLLVEGNLRSPEIRNGGSLDLVDLGAKSKWERTLTVQPTKKPKKNKGRFFVASFDCKELPDIVGRYSVSLTD